MYRLLKFSSISLLALAVLLAVLFSSWYYTYHRLTFEAQIAEVVVDPLGEKVYRAMLTTGDGCTVRTFDLHGDQWRIDSQFVKWKSFATLLGFDPLYRLERIEGRYKRIEDQNRLSKFSYALGDESAVDLVRVTDVLGRFNFLFDATYGSSTYNAMDPDQVYKIYETDSGIITRTEPRDRSLAAEQSSLALRKSKSCGRSTFWRAFSLWVNEKLTAAATPAA